MSETTKKRARTDDDVCAICLESLATGDSELFELQACDHAFHSKCIGKWVQRSNYTCPICREDLTDGDVGATVGPSGWLLVVTDPSIQPDIRSPVQFVGGYLS